MRDPLRLAAPQLMLLLQQHDDGPAFGRLVGEACELRGIGQLFHADAGRGEDLRRHPVAEGDGSRLVEQQRIHVARCLHGAPTHRQDVLAQEPVHSRDADGGQEAADGGRDQTDQQGDHSGRAQPDPGIEPYRHQRDAGQQKHDGQPDQQDVQRDLVRRLLPRRAFHQADHPVQERLAGVHRDAHHDAIREHFRAASYR